MQTSETPGPGLLDAVAASAGYAPETPARALLAALWDASDGDRDDEEALAGAAKRLGAEAAEAGDRLADVVSRVLSLGRALAERAQAAGAEEAAARLAPLTDAAAASAAAGWEEARADRRDAWLSFLTHDIKGRLNVVNLNLWLLRQPPSQSAAATPGRDADKHEKIERAMSRVLEVLKDVRELNARAEGPVPTHKAPV